MTLISTGAVGSSFHSISFPSEWGPVLRVMVGSSPPVSIQLVSPASGDETTVSFKWESELPLFPFN